MTPADYKKLPHNEKVKVDMKDHANVKSASGAGAVNNKGIGNNYLGGTVLRRIIKQ